MGGRKATSRSTDRECFSGSARSESLSMRVHSLHGNWEIPDWPHWWSAQGRCNADACDARLGEVRHQHSTEEAREQCATTGSGAGGGKGGDQGEQASTSHVPDAEPGARVPGVDACTASQPWGHPRWSNAACRHIPKVGAGWGSTSRPDLCRGYRVTGIPTAMQFFAPSASAVTCVSCDRPCFLAALTTHVLIVWS